jgi:hypothetical protein
MIGPSASANVPVLALRLAPIVSFEVAPLVVTLNLASCIRSALTAQGVSVSTRIACRRLPEAVVAKVPGQEPCRNLGFFHG